VPDGKYWYDKLDAAVKLAEKQVDADIARVLK
jgi:hypothetical protein